MIARRRATLGARWLFIIWKFISCPLFLSSLAFSICLPHPIIRSLCLKWVWKSYCWIFSHLSKNEFSLHFCLQTQLLPWCLRFNIPILSMHALFSVGRKWTGPSRESVTGAVTGESEKNSHKWGPGVRVINFMEFGFARLHAEGDCHNWATISDR